VLRSSLRLALASLLAFAAFVPSHETVAEGMVATWTLAPEGEAEFVADLNAARAAQGLAPLTVDSSMRAAARDWAVWMAENDTLQHAADIVTGAPADWVKVGENVGRGGSVVSVFNAFMASPGHAANVLDPKYTRVGVGMVWNPDGVLYTTHRFAATASGPAPTPTATPVPAAATATPVPKPTAAPAPTAAPVIPTPTLPQLAFVDDTGAATPERVRATMSILLAATD
jgi:hypothetical protein